MERPRSGEASMRDQSSRNQRIRSHGKARPPGRLGTAGSRVRPRQRNPAGRRSSAHLLAFDSVHGRWKARNLGERGLDLDSTVRRSPIRASHEPGRGRLGASRRRRRDRMRPAGSGPRSSLTPTSIDGVRKVIVAAPVRAGALNLVGRGERQPLRPGTPSTSSRRRPAPPTVSPRWSRCIHEESASGTDRSPPSTT